MGARNGRQQGVAGAQAIRATQDLVLSHVPPAPIPPCRCAMAPVDGDSRLAKASVRLQAIPLVFPSERQDVAMRIARLGHIVLVAAKDPASASVHKALAHNPQLQVAARREAVAVPELVFLATSNEANAAVVNAVAATTGRERYEWFCQKYHNQAKGTSKCHWGSSICPLPLIVALIQSLMTGIRWK